MIPFHGFSQDISGIWVGYMYNDTTQQTIHYELAINDVDGKTNGFSHTTFVIDGIKNIGVKEVKVRVKNDHVFIEDEKFVYDNYTEPAAKGVKMFSFLTYSKNDTSEILSGIWRTNATRKYNPLTGRLFLQKKNNQAPRQTIIVKKLTELGLDNQLAFLPPVIPQNTVALNQPAGNGSPGTRLEKASARQPVAVSGAAPVTLDKGAKNGDNPNPGRAERRSPPASHAGATDTAVQEAARTGGHPPPGRAERRPPLASPAGGTDRDSQDVAKTGDNAAKRGTNSQLPAATAVTGGDTITPVAGEKGQNPLQTAEKTHPSKPGATTGDVSSNTGGHTTATATNVRAAESSGQPDVTTAGVTPNETRRQRPDSAENQAVDKGEAGVMQPRSGGRELNSPDNKKEAGVNVGRKQTVNTVPNANEVPGNEVKMTASATVQQASGLDKTRSQVNGMSGAITSRKDNRTSAQPEKPAPATTAARSNEKAQTPVTNPDTEQKAGESPAGGIAVASQKTSPQVAVQATSKQTAPGVSGNPPAGSVTPGDKQEKSRTISVAPVVQPQAAKAAADIASRKLETIRTVDIAHDSLLFSLYDNGSIDGDTVSVLVNGKVIMPRVGLLATAISKTVYLTPDMGDSISVVMYAENLGSIPPNTGLLVIHDGPRIYEIRFSGDLNKNSKIILVRKKKT